MKTIEEKAKAYDEALERADAIYPGLHEQDKKVLEYIFPSLLESEDESVLERIIELVKRFALGDEKGPMLSYLEKQKEQKPAEWGEEDEKVLNSTIYWLAYLLTSRRAEDISTTDCSSSVKKTLDKLKSLRPQPHWRPNKIQIEALEHCVAYYGDKFNSPDENILRGLLTDLKQL